MLNYNTHAKQSFQSNLIIILILLSLFYPLLTLTQLFLFDAILINSMTIKMLIAICMVGLLLFAYKENFIEPLFFLNTLPTIVIIFLAYNFFIILSNHLETDGFINTFKAFAYNYSLFPFLLFVLFLTPFSSKSIFLLRTFLVILIFADIIAIWQYISNSYLYPDTLVSSLMKYDAIKIDHIGGQVRAFGFFKSPLELGMVNTLVAIFSLWHYYKKAINFNWPIILLFSIAIAASYSTFSRTAILMTFIGCIVVFFYVFRYDKYKLKSTGILLSFLILPIIILLHYYLQSSGTHIQTTTTIHTVSNPTNLFIRFEIWSNIITDLSFKELIFGQGTIQNGDYLQNAYIVDNLYIGVLVTGGIIGSSLFFWIIYLIFLYFKNHAYIPAIAFLVSFLVGGLTENLMHLAYFLFFPPIFMMIFMNSKDCKQTVPLPLK